MIAICFLCLYPTDYLKPCDVCHKQICAVCRRVKGGVRCLQCVEHIGA